MKDLTEAELIEIEQRAYNLNAALDYDPAEMRRSDLEDRWDWISDRMLQVSRDIERLCEQIRAARETPCAPSR